MDYSTKAWDGTASRWPDTDSYCQSCVLDLNESGTDKVQAQCKLPVFEPGGALNINALGPASAALAGARGGLVGVSPVDKKKAAKKLVSLYRQAKSDGKIDQDPPPSLTKLAQ